MRVVVSGANGFLGSWVSRILSESQQVFGFVRPNADTKRMGGIDLTQIKENLLSFDM